MLFSVILPFIFAFSCLALKKIGQRKIKSAIVIAMQTVVTAAGMVTIFSDTVSTGRFTIADGISLGLASDITANSSASSQLWHG